MITIEIIPNTGSGRVELVRETVPMVGDEVYWRKLKHESSKFKDYVGIVTKRKFYYDEGDVVVIYVDKIVKTE